jgi:hypothetical protein
MWGMLCGRRRDCALTRHFYVVCVCQFKAIFLLGERIPAPREYKGEAHTLGRISILVSTPVVVPPLALDHARACASISGRCALRRVINLLAPFTFGLA